MVLDASRAVYVLSGATEHQPTGIPSLTRLSSLAILSVLLEQPNSELRKRQPMQEQ
jgi:hypothetical protein